MKSGSAGLRPVSLCSALAELAVGPQASSVVIGDPFFCDQHLVDNKH
jgi:hypothetical protein